MRRVGAVVVVVVLLTRSVVVAAAVNALWCTCYHGSVLKQSFSKFQRLFLFT